MNTTRFESLTKDEKKALTVNDFTVSELTEIINETIFDKEVDKEIANFRFVKSCTIERTAEYIGYDWKTIQKRIPIIREKLNKTIQMIVY